MFVQILASEQKCMSAQICMINRRAYKTQMSTKFGTVLVQETLFDTPPVLGQN